MAASATLIPAKIAVPALPADTLARPRLEAALNLAARAPLVVLRAPAGYGKTRALVQFCHTSSADEEMRLICWLSLDPGEDEPYQFWRYLAGALDSTVRDSQADEAWSLEAEPPATLDMAAPATAFLAALNRLDVPLYLVLDDFHVITHARVHTGLAFLVKYLPEHVRLFVATRDALPGPLAHGVINGRGQTLDAFTLAFDRAETSVWLGTVLSAERVEGVLDAVWSRTSGWPVGLKLLGEGFARAGAPVPLWLVEPDAPVFTAALEAYLDTEFYQSLMPGVQTFLNRVAPLEWFDEALAQRLCPDANVFAALAYLERNQLFLESVVVDSGSLRFRLQPLIRQFLMQKLQHTGADRASRENAARALSAEGQVAAALAQALAAGSQPLLRGLLVQHGTELMHRAQYGLIMRCLQQLPEPTGRHDPELFLIRAWVEVIYGSPERVQLWLQAGADSAAGPAWQDQFLALAAHADYACADPVRAGELARTVLARQTQPGLPRSGAAIILANIAFDQGQLDDARALSEQAAVTSREAGNWDAVLWTLNLQARIAQARGDFEQALQTVRDALDYADAHQVLPGFNRVLARIIAIDINLELYRLRDARALAERAQEECRVGQEHWRVHLHSWLLKCEMLRGKPDVMTRLARQHEPILHDLSGSDVLRPYSVENHLLWWLVQGERHRLEGWVKTQAEPEATLSPANALLWRVRIYAALLSSDPGRAVDTAYTLRRRAAACGMRPEATRFGLLQVAGYARLNRVEEADRLAEQLIPEASKLGLIASWLYHQASLMPVLRRVLDAGRLSSDSMAYVERVLRLNRQRHIAPSWETDQIPGALQAEGVSRKEWRVLQLILAGYRNDDIAASSFVALSTVKTHINNLYKKLGVGSRQEAVQRAQALGVTPDTWVRTAEKPPTARSGSATG